MKKVCMFGLGFVGLPLALSFAMRGCKVTGVDIDVNLVDELNRGITHHFETYQGKTIQEILREELAKGSFKAITDGLKAMEECDNIIVTVGIPVENYKSDITPLIEVCKTVGQGLKKGDLVLIRSTVIPGTTRNIIMPILERESGLKAGKDFYLAYSSERIAEGKAFDEFENMPAALAGIDEESTAKALELMSIVTKAPITQASSMEVVETAKVMENISRDVNIAMVNEFARFAKAMGLDIFEVIKVANTHKRVNLLTPGPGVGGYCLPNAVFYLLPKAEELNVKLDLLLTARRVNEEMPRFVADLVLRNLPVAPNQARIAALGLAMKDFSNDDRISPAHMVIKHLQNAGCTVKAFDPAVPSRYDYKVDTVEEAVKDAHGIVILARQTAIDFMNLDYYYRLMSKEGTPFIVDTKNIYQDDEWVTAKGFKLEKL
ncbi:UDP-N-acetyl-D-mannosaminuronic acid dehydrogenase [Thermosyntropha lipolytica DSM 11003]|uniref:UDP-N-acetyl-D-mannosaminuronic acid dehydrogenase n=1 Tax=Thermosyntropha lipolytica DSM 11003 TaxID=1123382 RepID=A0A1M5JQL5_9FIRM|nr:nucleotide sugar dehydrogenase [Thermosyntropha lipolytica]SHG42841.1 UDP-N-acetyl-D-mannosaminuronic acid dehydrogenase [Thermosyntropha lipolytica DSM 11003]